MQSKTKGLEKVYPLAYSFSPLVHLVHLYKYVHADYRRVPEEKELFNVSVKLNEAQEFAIIESGN